MQEQYLTSGVRRMYGSTRELISLQLWLKKHGYVCRAGHGHLHVCQRKEDGGPIGGSSTHDKSFTESWFAQDRRRMAVMAYFRLYFTFWIDR